MSKHWSTSAVEQIRGSIKEAIGKITGNGKLESEGATEKAGVEQPAPAVEVDDTVRGVSRQPTSTS